MTHTHVFIYVSVRRQGGTALVSKCACGEPAPLPTYSIGLLKPLHLVVDRRRGY